MQLKTAIERRFRQSKRSGGGGLRAQAQLLDVSRSTLHRWMEGKALPIRRGDLRRLSAWLGVSVEDVQAMVTDQKKEASNG